MIPPHIIVEGASERRFVEHVLKDHLKQYNLDTKPSVVITKRDKRTGGVFEGGIGEGQYGKLIKNITNRIEDETHPHARFTTMADLYGFRRAIPKIERKKEIDQVSYREKLRFYETKLQDDINNPKFIPYIQPHEFETFLFVEPAKLLVIEPEMKREVLELQKIAGSFDSPEEINDGEKTAPSKRIENIISKYRLKKVRIATEMIPKIGLPMLRERCRHFDDWVTKLETLSNN